MRTWPVCPRKPGGLRFQGEERGAPLLTVKIFTNLKSGCHGVTHHGATSLIAPRVGLILMKTFVNMKSGCHGVTGDGVTPSFGV